MTGQRVMYMTGKAIAPAMVYLYGTQLKQEGDTLSLTNAYMASGRTLLTLQSQTNYQAHRRVPQLPLLVPGYRYRLKREITSQPEGRCLVGLDFYNRQGDVIERLVLRPDEESFLCPEAAYTYELILTNAGCHQLTISSIELIEESQQTAIPLTLPVEKYYTEAERPQELAFVSSLLKQAPGGSQYGR
ncbi:accessory Sec system protein Asp3 [Streptococcus sp. DD12]|uniref:accessory Sec system protein Asp3 n=1 Tax=Streptococcus sp. DD12 TaxID=1777880 RepID=UPI00079A7CEA|nr:accessory Sec system protein Asp3 [Streptococcus sp. DD12]KXT76462.1 Accessory secretory protein Asp3 [Streptococcus sp. DD12]